MQCLGLRLAGDLIDQVNERGEPIIGDTLLLLLNAHWEEIPFTLPGTSDGNVWQTLIDTADPDRPLEIRVRPPGEQFPLYGRSVALFRTVHEGEAAQLISSTQAEFMRERGGGGTGAGGGSTGGSTL